jgi:uncharacterized protein YgiM (DUF1202 family)
VLRLSLSAIIVGVCISGSALPAQATLFCEVLKTKDGFVALRDKPSTKSKVLRRLTVGEDVQIDSTRKEANGWAPVIYTGNDRSKNVIGWVRGSLISNECG